jgi:5-methylthioadenosine/S-adenosylhomocysteine deaminase
MSNDNLDILEEARLIALVHKGIERDPSFLAGDLALQMATCMGAEAIGLGDRIGRLKPGYLADLAVVEIKEPHWIPAPDPIMALLYAASSRDVIHVMVGGNWVMKDRKILTVHEEEILAKAREITGA